MHAAPLYCKDVTVSLTERGLAKLLNERNLRPDPMRCLRASALRSTSRAYACGGRSGRYPKRGLRLHCSGRRSLVLPNGILGGGNAPLAYSSDLTIRSLYD